MTGESLFVVIVALVLLVFVPFDIYVAWRLSQLALQKPRIASLTGAAVRSIAIAVAGVLFAILGVQSLVFLTSGERLFPSPIPTVLIAAGAVVVSLPNLYFLRILRRFALEAEEYRAHKRDAEPPGDLP